MTWEMIAPTQIDDELWLSGLPEGWVGSEFRTVLGCCVENDYRTAGRTFRRHAPFADSDYVPAVLVDGLAEWVNKRREVGPVLVHCHWGLNRSALVAGLSLVKRGMTPDAAIALMREKRHANVLHNVTFENWLREQR